MNGKAIALFMGSAGVVIWATPSSVMAQESQSSLPTADTADIVVTANKRQENINKVGLTITAVSGDLLAERKVTSLEDVASLVPGLAFSASTTNTPIFTLRGVGFNESSLGVYPAVSVYLDQAPLSFPVLASHSAYDLERVEVLKGPQGTLFGQNSTGGAINYIAAKPTSSFEAGGDISYGRFNQIEGNAYISGPITDTLRGRVAMTALNSDDWQYSVSRDDTNGHQSYVAGRLLLDWDASDSVRFAFNLNGWRDKSQPQAQQVIALRPAFSGTVVPGFLQTQLVPDNARAADWSNVVMDPALGSVDPASGAPVAGTARPADFDPFANRRMVQSSLRGDFDLTDSLTLTSMTSYADYKQRQRTDGDGNPLIVFDLYRNDGYVKSFNQELRLANDPRMPFRWILGANYEKSTTFENQLLRYADSSNFRAANLFINGSGVTNKQKIENYAVFGSVEYALTDQLTLKASGRYTQSKNRANICGYTIENGNVDKLFNLLGGLLGTVPFTPVGVAGCYTLNENNVPGQPFIRTLKEDNFSFRAGVDYQVTPETLLYANISRGYKAGSFPSLAAAVYAGLEPVTQESVTAYEGGVKTQLLDRRVSLTAAAFYYDYRDKQIRGKIFDPLFGNLDALINVPKARIYGAEADVTVRPLDGLTINGALTYLNSKIQEGPSAPRNYNILGVQDEFAGDPLPFTPKWSGTVNVDYRGKTANGGTPFIGVSINARSGADAAPGARRIAYAPAGDAQVVVLRDGVTYPFAIKGYATVDGRVGYEAPDGAWRVMLWGKNIFNRYYWTTVIPSNDSAARFAGRPVTYGVTVAFKVN